MQSATITLRVLLKYSLITICITGFLGYTIWQSRLLLVGPVIEFTDSVPVSQSERFVTIEGTTRNIVKVTLNGRDIYTDKNGNFKEVLVLENGYTIATIEGTDRYGRQTTLTREFVYQPLIISR